MYAQTLFAAAALAGAVSAHEPVVARVAVPVPQVPEAAAVAAAEGAAEAVAAEGFVVDEAPVMEAPRPHGNGTIITTTKIVDVLPTYCPDKINYITHNEKVYTVEGPTWYTITDCPCTSTYTTECFTCKASPTHKEHHGEEKPSKPTHAPDCEDCEEGETVGGKKPEGPKEETPEKPETPEGPETPENNVEVSGAETMLKQGLLAVGMAVAVGVATFGAAGF